MPAAVSRPVIDSVLLVDHYERPASLRFAATSLPGHLIQLMDRGVARQQVCGREYTLTPGDVIWYHEDEAVTGEVIDGPWSFYTVNFVAPRLPPPPFERRVRPGSAAVGAAFAALLDAWRDDEAGPPVRELRVQSHLLALLAAVADTTDAVGFRTHPLTRLWWEAETFVRANLGVPMTLPELAARVGTSPATMARACHEAVALPPARRIKQVRMSLARGLVWHSELGIGEIAAQVGYPRVHEFSRDYRKHFATTPSAARVSARQARSGVHLDID